jgi:hypothetical protein
VERYLGLVVARLGHRSRAISHLESALARLRTSGSHPYIARTLLDLAAVLASGTPSETARAAELTREATDLAERFELDWEFHDHPTGL